MKILRLITSFRGKDSQSTQLGDTIVDKIKMQYPKTDVVTRDLVKNEIPHLNQLHFTSFMTPSETLSPELQHAISFSDIALNELINADVLVIDVPMYNYSIPSSLKAWIDHIVRAGVTFNYTENGVEGLVKNKKAFLAIATGGIYSDSPIKDFDFTEKYLRNVLGFIGISDVTAFRVEGTAIPGLKEMALPKAIQSVANHNF